MFLLRSLLSKVVWLQAWGKPRGSMILARKKCYGKTRTRSVVIAQSFESIAHLHQTFSSVVVTLSTQGSRILVGDMQESVYFAVYKAPENRLLVFADDGQPRWITCSTTVDHTTVATCDRFGNIFVNRLDIKVSDQVDDDPTGAGILYERAYSWVRRTRRTSWPTFTLATSLRAFIRSRWWPVAGRCWYTPAYTVRLVCSCRSRRKRTSTLSRRSSSIFARNRRASSAGTTSHGEATMYL